MLKSFFLQAEWAWFPEPLLMVKCSDPCHGGSFLTLLQFVVFWGSQFWTQDLMWSDKCWEGGETSPGSGPVCAAQEAAPSLLPGHTGLMWSLLPTRIPRSLPAELLPSWPLFTLCCCKGFFPSWVGEFAFVLLEFHKVSVETFFNLSRFFWRAVTIGSPQFGTSNVLLKQYQKYLFYIFNLDCSLN